jgi:hypothetical protein
MLSLLKLDARAGMLRGGRGHANAYSPEWVLPHHNALPENLKRLRVRLHTFKRVLSGRTVLQYVLVITGEATCGYGRQLPRFARSSDRSWAATAAKMQRIRCSKIVSVRPDACVMLPHLFDVVCSSNTLSTGPWHDVTAACHASPVAAFTRICLQNQPLCSKRCLFSSHR